MNTLHLMSGVNTLRPMQGVRWKHPASHAEHPPFHARNTLHEMGGHQAVHQSSFTIPLVLARPHRFASRRRELPIASDVENGQ